MGTQVQIQSEEFIHNAKRTFSKLKNKTEYHDVTLVCDDIDTNSISAHRVVLSVASKYFDKVLKINKSPHPLICLEGINLKFLNHILDYIYYGELMIQENDLSEFLKIAKRLKLEGIMLPRMGERDNSSSLLNDGHDLSILPILEKEELNEKLPNINFPESYDKGYHNSEQVKLSTDLDQKPCDEKSINHFLQELEQITVVEPKDLGNDKQNHSSALSSPKSEIMIGEVYSQAQTEVIGQRKVLEILGTPNNRSNNQVNGQSKISDIFSTPNLIMNSNEFATIEDYDDALFGQIERELPGTGFKCKICSFKRRQRLQVKEHVEIHFRVTFTCPNCFKSMKTRSSLRAHWIKTHGKPRI